MKAKVFRKCLSAAIMSIGLVSAAFADVITLDIQAHGLTSNAAATGFITFDTALLPTIGTDLVQTPLTPAVSDLQLTITGAAAGGNGTFGLSDFSSISFSTPIALTLDFSQQLIGQVLANGCIYGTSTGDCDLGNAGDFNLFAVANSAAPNGTYYFRLTAATGEELLITSLIPEAAVPEPTTVALFGLGLLGFAASRRKSAKSKNA
jgi:hypothetical protein